LRYPKTVFTNKTGTGLSSEVTKRDLRLIGSPKPIIAKLRLSYGETATITVNLEGKQFNGEWAIITTKTFTSLTPKYIHSEGQTRCHKYRLNITANTNVTVTSAQIGTGSVEN